MYSPFDTTDSSIYNLSLSLKRLVCQKNYSNHYVYKLKNASANDVSLSAIK